MTQFMGTHVNKVDAKGRISIPAAFRASLRGATTDGSAAVASLVLRPSHTQACIEGWPVAAFQALATPLAGLDVFSEEHDDMAATLYADAYPIDADREGRIMLPDSLVGHAGLRETAVFMGVGPIFQIWEPGAAERRVAEARERTRARKLTLAGNR